MIQLLILISEKIQLKIKKKYRELDYIRNMSDFESVRERVVSQFNSAQVEVDPFPYVEVPNCLDLETFRKLRSMLPKIDGGMVEKNYAGLTNKAEMQRLTAIVGVHQLSDPEKDKFWKSFCESVILSENLLRCLFLKFAGKGKVSHDKLVFLGRAGGKVYFKQGKQTYSAEATIYRDKGGYSLEVHTDAANRVLTSIWYLPSEESATSMESFGTSLYIAKDPKFKDTKGVRLPFENFTKVKTLPFVPCYAFSFLRGDRSFHAVEEFRCENETRDTLGIHVRRCKNVPSCL